MGITGVASSVIVEYVRKQFNSGNFDLAFTVVNADSPLEDDAKKAMQITTEANFDRISADIQQENKNTVRKLLKTWEGNIDISLRIPQSKPH